jgi:hypothetical protein
MGGAVMAHESIISEEQALQILRNDLRRIALEKRAADLTGAGPERRAEIMAQIEAEIEKELRLRARPTDRSFLLH